MRRSNLSEYTSMWLMVMFDLPVKKKNERKAYQQFHKMLLCEGFIMLQYSVYSRFCRNLERVEAVKNHIKDHLPPAGQVRMLMVTEKQFAGTEIYLGNKRAPTEDPPQQLTLF